MWKAETNDNYQAQSIGRRMRFYYKQELVSELHVGTPDQHRLVLEYWAHLKVSPDRALLAPQLLEDYIGYKLDDVSLAEDGKTLLLNGKSIGVI